MFEFHQTESNFEFVLMAFLNFSCIIITEYTVKYASNEKTLQSVGYKFGGFWGFCGCGYSLGFPQVFCGCGIEINSHSTPVYFPVHIAVKFQC